MNYNIFHFPEKGNAILSYVSVQVFIFCFSSFLKKLLRVFIVKGKYHCFTCIVFIVISFSVNFN